MKRNMVLGIVFMATVMISACSPKGDPESDFKAEPVNGGKGVRITEYLGDKWEVNIPQKIQKLPVTHIGDGAFAARKLIKVIIPKSVTEIGDSAFRGNQLTSVTIPKSVTKIGSGAFYGNQLTSITIPNSVAEIGDSAFEGSWGRDDDGNMFSKGTLTSVTIGNSVTEIGDSAFRGNQLTKVTIPDSVTKIGGWAFSGNQLTSIIIPKNVTEIGTATFSYNPLTNVSIASGNTALVIKDSFLLSNDEKILVMYVGNEKNITIPNGVEEIRAYTFAGQEQELTEITIPKSVTAIRGQRTFDANTLTSVTFEGNKIDIFYYAFNQDGRNRGELVREYERGGAGTYVKNGRTWTKQ